MSPRLTIVLPLKGRALFSLRFLWHANKLRLPYRFLLADGQVNDAAARYLENSREAFPALDVEYVRYPDDASYSRYFAKMSDAFQRVRTPYAMWADNDDFLGFDGIERALDFLDAHADYVCARGRIAAFSVYSGLDNRDNGICGRLNRLRTTYDTSSISAPCVSDRLREEIIDPGLFYAVCRSEALSAIFRESAEIDFSDLMLHEVYLTLRTLTLGKVNVDKSVVGYFRQLGTSLTHEPSRDWVRHLLRSRFTSDAHNVVERISAAAVAADGDDAATGEDVRTIMGHYFHWFLSTQYGWLAQLKRIIRARLPRLTRYLQNRPRFSVARERTALIRKLAVAGAPHEGLKRFRAELALIETALSPRAFAAYAAPFLAPARSDDNRRRDWF